MSERPTNQEARPEFGLLTWEQRDLFEETLGMALSEWMFKNDFHKDMVLAGSFVEADGDIVEPFRLTVFANEDSRWADDEEHYLWKMGLIRTEWRGAMAEYRAEREAKGKEEERDHI